MKPVKRSLYLLYYIKETDFKQIRKFRKHAAAESGRSSLSILFDSVMSVYRYNISLKDYYCFRFYGLPDAEREKWAGTGYMYEYQLKMNPEGAREVLENKILFLRSFGSLVKRKFHTIDELISDRHLVQSMLGDSSGRLVLKGSRGQVGAEVKVVSSNDFSAESIIKFMKENNLDLAEQYVLQHNSLMELSPSGLNTVRIFTQLSGKNVDILGARLRVSVNSPVDNMAAGNLAAPVDIETGIVSGPAIYSDITKQGRSSHPVTGKSIEGFKIPFWEKVITMSKNAAEMTPLNKSVGWDIAVTNEGPELIEGNHNWCKLLWQMPVNMGLKPMLEKYT